MDTAEDYGDYLLRDKQITVDEYAACLDEYKAIISQ
jgi:hypothetical protein